MNTYTITVIHNAFSDVAKPVARLRAEGEDVKDALEDAYHATNSFDDPWTSNVAINALAGSQCRSTSAGDIMLVHEVDDNGYRSDELYDIYSVESFGFKRLDGDDMVAFSVTSGDKREWLYCKLPAKVIAKLALAQA